ncbi:hypothetical protein GWI33_016621 [Rhynchophorus ferrugineus]|uniref:Uncharacterized protein n=1 Tax=Rhynchophorus ferrugineus TaxID=354439 RepID=A0A834I1C9_RHYFE|nr:hypothetical protein GWI33_016621 [Rhynchophorus ferrugineus]
MESILRETPRPTYPSSPSPAGPCHVIFLIHPPAGTNLFPQIPDAARAAVITRNSPGGPQRKAIKSDSVMAEFTSTTIEHLIGQTHHRTKRSTPTSMGNVVTRFSKDFDGLTRRTVAEPGVNHRRGEGPTPRGKHS